MGERDWEICLGTHVLDLLWVPSRWQGVLHKWKTLLYMEWVELIADCL